jgi:hypothetical protein
MLLQFLISLNYVKIVQSTPSLAANTSQKSGSNTASQLELLQQALEQQSKPPFQNIIDPLTWQKQQRDAPLKHS